MLVLNDLEQAVLSVTPVNVKGKPAPVQNPVWKSSDESVAVVVADADGLSAVVVAKAPGTAQISITADADMSEGVSEITGTLDVKVVPSQAVGFTINTAAPVLQPDPVEPPAPEPVPPVVEPAPEQTTPPADPPV
jgi:hypothetical protein